MRIISARSGYDCNHSTRDYGYISGMEVYYDYGTFDIKFEVPYSTELFDILKQYKNLGAAKRFNVIGITLMLYCEDYNEDPREYVDLAHEIRDALIAKNKEVMALLDLYQGESAKYDKLEPETELGKRLKRDLTTTF